MSTISPGPEELIYPPSRAAQVIVENNFGKVSYSAKKKKAKKKNAEKRKG